MPILGLRFARWATDIASGRRTIALVSALRETYTSGDEVHLLSTEPTFKAFVRSAVIVSVRAVKLLDVIDADLDGLNARTREEFLTRWDAMNPDLSADGNPEVSRVEWRYGEEAVTEWAWVLSA
jgi:uncharacterized protein YqfB (UPF0267 family)